MPALVKTEDFLLQQTFSEEKPRQQNIMLYVYRVRWRGRRHIGRTKDWEFKQLISTFTFIRRHDGSFRELARATAPLNEGSEKRRCDYCIFSLTVRLTRRGSNYEPCLRKVGPRFNVRLENLKRALSLQEKECKLPNNEDSEEDSLRPILKDFLGIWTHVLLFQRSVVQDTGQEVDLNRTIKSAREGLLLTVETVTRRRKMV